MLVVCAFVATLLAPWPVLAEAPCPKGAPREWCAPGMIPFTIVDAQGQMDGRHRDGTEVQWRRPAWKGALRIRLTRGRGGTRVAYSAVTGGKETARKVYVKTGGSLSLEPGRDVPADWFGEAGVVTIRVDHPPRAK